MVRRRSPTRLLTRPTESGYEEYSMSEKKLNGKVALITGASKGLGKAMALALGSAGAKLALVSRNADQLNAVAKESQVAGAEARVFIADVAREEQVARIEREVTAAYGAV